MKNLFMASLVFISTNVFASKLVITKNLTNPILNSADKEIAALELITHSGMKKVLELKGTAKTSQGLRESAVKQALHTLCGFFDEGVSIDLNSKDEKGTKIAVSDLTDSTSTYEGDAEYATLFKAISVINKQVGVEVYSGGASGNNTSGTVLGFYDVTNNELAVYANTNCGSDD